MIKTNSSSGYGPVAEICRDRWSVFDNLPKEVRDFINYAEFNISVERSISDNINRIGVDRVINATKEMFEDKKKHDLRTVWNIK